MRFRAWVHVHVGRPFAKFFRDRGTHLAAMVAYFALLSFVPLVFLLLAGLGLIGQVDASSALVSYLEDIFPGQSVEQIVSVVRAIQRNAGTLSIIGGVGLAWSSLSLFSALESAELFASIGTSGAVYPAAGFVQAAAAYGARTLELNLVPSDGSHFFDEARHGPAGQLVPEWVRELLG